MDSGQALFRATGFRGGSEPDETDDVDEGDILAEVVRPRGTGWLEGLGMALGTVDVAAPCCMLAKLAPNERE